MDATDVSEVRGQLGVTQAELATVLGVTQPAVAAWEAGRRRPTGTVATRLAVIAATLSGKTRIYGEFRGRPIELPDELWTPIPLPDENVLPIHLDWTPNVAPWSTRDDRHRAELYARVLDEGKPPDIRFWIDPDRLVDLWPDVPVARHMREPVQSMVDMLQAA